MVSKRTKACAITPKVKKAVLERDGHVCIFCKSIYANAEAHVIPRSKGGLGVEKNIITVCRICHNRMDQTTDRKKMLEFAKNYLRSIYEDWKEEDLIYVRFNKRITTEE